ncbi:MAG: hypothetical protein M1818_000361 [Claussenomyces sp. TS43310]|nr:MAG: hypothetical protein M1818_000361 [Claussenomyces sp. TS43310]
MSSSARNSAEHTGEAVEADEQTPVATTSTYVSLSQAVHARRAEYTRPRTIKVKVGTWNVAACPGVEKDIEGWFVEGKGIDKRLVGLRISDAIEQDGSQDNIESLDAQEFRRSKKQSTIPLNDKGTIIGGDEIGLYVLGLQEVVDIGSAKEYITKIYNDPGPLARWKRVLERALPSGYSLISGQQLSGILLLVYASPEIAPSISSVSSVPVGTGVMGYLGNKGAISTRIVLGETTRLVFINSHLASGTDLTHLDRRCWDVTQILTRTRFDPISRAGVLDDTHEAIGDEDFAFWFGDLNFRLDGLPGEDIRRLLTLHTRGEYGAESKGTKIMDKELSNNYEPIVVRQVASDDEDDSEESGSSSQIKASEHGTEDTSLPDPDDFLQDPSSDPTSLQATLDSLLPHDQLRHVQKAKKAFHDGWREGPITFLPTYKYDVGSMGVFDSSEKKRAPSWCDRILFRTRFDKQEYDGKSREQELARLKDEEMKARGLDHAGDDDEVLFDYNPESDGVEDVYDEAEDADPQGSEIVTTEGFLDSIELDVYTSHQRVLSSDHKPLDAVFTLRYDAVVPELKSKVQQEVARELDRAENETRPGITIVIDHSHTEDTAIKGGHSPPSLGEAEGVDFGHVRYLHRNVRGLTIANTGQVTAKFAFVDRPGDNGEADRVAPNWLAVKFVGSEWNEDEQSVKHIGSQIDLEPGDAINVLLEVFVEDMDRVKRLNDGKEHLDDVLVLRVTDGRDHFVPIRGHWLQSCFGRSIDQLIRIPEGGVRALTPPRKGDGPPVNRGEEVCWSAPRELFKLTECCQTLTERAMADKDMLDIEIPADSPGWPFEPPWIFGDEEVREQSRSSLVEALDSDKNLVDSFPLEASAVERLELVSEILLMFVNSLSDGIVPEDMWMRVDEQLQAQKQLPPDEERTLVLDTLSASPHHNISLVFLTSLLTKMIAEVAPTSRSATVSKMSSIRRSLSLKGRTAPVPVPDASIVKRRNVERRFAEMFAPAIFRSSAAREKDRDRSRKREIVGIFLQGNLERTS